MTESDGQAFYIVDDDELVRNSLQSVLESAGKRVRSFSSGNKFIEAVPDLTPSCTILDVMMPGMDGLQVLDRLRQCWPETSVVMISGFGDVPKAVQALKSGAVDFLEKPFSPNDVLATLEKATQSQPLGSGQNAISSEHDEILNSLSKRELEILTLLAQGDQNKVVAFKLGISPRTVEVHRARIMHRLGVSSFAELVRIAVLSSLEIS